MKIKFIYLLILSVLELTKANKSVYYQDNKDIKIYILNSIDSPPALITEKDFWSHKNNLDQLTIKSVGIKRRVMNSLNLLTKEEITYDFSIKVAILFNDGIKKDTLYGDKFLLDWKHKNINYTDKKKIYQKMFGGLMLFQYEN